jgi:dynein heavy chain
LFICGFLFHSSATDKLGKDEFMFFLTRGISLENKIPNPDPSWLNEKIWDEVCRLDNLPAFSGEISLTL